MKTNRYENIRRALAMGPTPESWARDIDGDAAYAMFCCQSAAEAAFIVACDPGTIRALLEERDQLAAALEAAREEREALLDALRQIAEWPDGGSRYGQEKIKRFAQHAIDALLSDQEEGEQR